MENYIIAVVNLEIFMNKKYFNHFSYQVTKDLNIETACIITGKQDLTKI